jgi:protein-S-isoprenylcysteine O-methyltransferase Ste14
VLVLVGEAFLLGLPWVMAWAGAFLALNFIYLLRFEEPGLERRFGGRYRAYKRAVRPGSRGSIPGDRTEPMIRNGWI